MISKKLEMLHAKVSTFSIPVKHLASPAVFNTIYYNH